MTQGRERDMLEHFRWNISEKLIKVLLLYNICKIFSIARATFLLGQLSVSHAWASAWGTVLGSRLLSDALRGLSAPPFGL